MARTSIGLDIGTRAVRLAEVQDGSGGPTLTRFGRVLLPTGAVDHGEVQDPGAVALAITSLWKRLGLSGKSVHVGVANRRVVVRTVELPAMSKEDLEGAIRFQAQEHIPIPLDEAVMDYEVLEEIEGENGEKKIRVLVVAAERSTVEPLLAAVRAANLEASTLELNAYPLVRCFGNGSIGAEAIVDIGAGVTNVVVQQGGKIRFTRILPTFGGDEFTTAISQQLGVDQVEAEALKRQASSMMQDRARHPIGARAAKPAAPAKRPLVTVSAGRVAPVAPVAPIAPVAPKAPVAPVAPGMTMEMEPADNEYEAPSVFESNGHAAHEAEPEPMPEHAVLTPVERAADVIAPLLDRFITEVRGSLDFYAGQPGAAPIDHVVLTGGGALMGGISEQLAAALGVEVKQGEPFNRVPIGRVEVTSEERAVAEPFIGLAVGLALAGMGA